MKRFAVVRTEARAEGTASAVRCRLARQGATHDAVLLDSLEDDLAESRRALRAVGDYLSRVEDALRDPRAARHRVLALATHLRPSHDAEYLEANLGRLRRRLAQVSARLSDVP